MRRLYFLALFLISCILGTIITSPTYALSNKVVISQIQIGNATSSRLIELYNNSDEPIEITNWCVYHSSASGKTVNKLVCFDVLSLSTHLILDSGSYVLIGSEELGIEADFTTDKGLGLVSGGHIFIENSQEEEIDRVGWGVAKESEGLSPVVIGEDNTDHIVERKKDEAGKYIDTDINSSDFSNSSLREKYSIGAISEVVDICSNIDEIQVLVPMGYELVPGGGCEPVVVDICRNLDGLQLALPFGYEFDENGDCQVDMCLNLNGLQLILPLGFDTDGLGNCTEHDECLNLLGIQTVLPDKYKKVSNGDCLLDLLPIKVTELLPNAIGVDAGNEFIEIYNPNNEIIDLSYYVLYVGPNLEKHYNFPTGAFIDSGAYLSFYNNEISFTLVNSSSRAQVRSLDGFVIDETPIYSDPDSGESWALIEGIWQYTNQPTPHGPNLPFVKVVEEVKTESEVKPCKDGQYRSEETNRCRNIVSDVVKLVPCAEGQERNTVTNRCRNIVTSENNLVPCKEGQERNPATNRCRSTSNISNEPKPCAENQERNPETNRCRNKISEMLEASYKPETVIGSPDNSVMYLSLAGIGVVAIGYGIWEWRVEIRKLLKKLFKIFK